MNFLKKLLDSEYKELCRFEKLAQEIEKLEPEMQSLKDEDFKDKTLEFKTMLEEGKTLEDIVVILITDSDNKLDDTFIPFIGKLKSELLEIVEKA